jgi:hypothetical protein
VASARTTYQDGQRTEGAKPSGQSFVWVSLRDPSPQELAAVQAEFGLPGPLVDSLATAAGRSCLEVAGELLVAVVKTASWVADEEVVRLGEVQLVLGEHFVVSVDRDTAILDRVRQDLQADPELAGAGPAAVLPSVADHAAEGYGPVLGAINDVVEEVEEAVFTLGGPGRPSASTTCRGRCWSCVGPWPRSPRCWTAWPASRTCPPASDSGGATSSGARTCSTWSRVPSALGVCCPTCCRPT